jgi:dTDP-4-dehydrorhamnose reductase
LSKYGMSKRAGEDVVIASCHKYIILRTSWVYGGAQNFVQTMLRLGKSHEQLTVVNDQIGGPTAALDIAIAIKKVVRQCSRTGFSDWGIYHFSGTPAVSWYDFAKEIFAGLDKPEVKPIPTSDYPTPAKRPAWSVLDCSRIKKVFGVEQPDWKASLKAALQNNSGD